MFIFATLCSLALSAATPTIAFVGSTPQSGDIISSFDNITLHFDFADVYAGLKADATHDWGVMIDGYDDWDFGTAKLYEGNPADNILLATTLDVTVNASSANYKLGTDFTFGFSGVEVSAGKMYTIVIDKFFFPALNGNVLYSNGTNVKANIVVYGPQNSGLTASSVVPAGGERLANLRDFHLTFDQSVTVTDSAEAKIMDGESVYAAATDIAVDPVDDKSVIVKFDSKPLYIDHEYKLVISDGAIVGADGTANVSTEIKYYGATYDYTPVAAVAPAAGSVVPEAEEITLDFDDFVSVAEDAVATIAENNSEVTKSALVYSLGKQVKVKFGNVPLCKGHNYVMTVPAGIITAATTGLPNREIKVNYAGGSLDYIQIFKSATPADGTVTDSIGGVKLESRFQSELTAYYFEPKKPITGKWYKGDEFVKDLTFSLPAGGYTISARIAEALEPNAVYRLVIPQGAIVIRDRNASKISDKVGNAEFSVSYVGAEEPVYLTTNVAGAEIKQPVKKGEIVTLTITPEEDWVVDKVTFFGTEIDPAAENVYTLPKVMASAPVVVTYRYNREIIFDADVTVGIAQMPGSNLTFSKNGGALLLQGLASGDAVAVYTAGGRLVGKYTAEKSTLGVNVSEGNVYIVIVNGKAVKVTM